MTLIIILIAIVVQRFLKFNSYSRQLNWATGYFHWMNSKVKQVTAGHGLLGLAILVVPIVLIAAMIFGIAYGIFGRLGTGILQLALVWYCLDARDIRKEPYDSATSQSLLLASYQNLFAILFWYGLFGPVGLVLYISILHLSRVIPKTITSSDDTTQEQEVVVAQQNSVSLHEYLVKTQGILDWIPVRLLGLSFALVGSFGAVFKLWLQKLFHGVSDPQTLVVEWGQAALKAESTAGQPLDSTIDLIDRSLLIWLVVILLLTVGIILG